MILTSTTGGHETAVNLTAVLFFVLYKRNDWIQKSPNRCPIFLAKTAHITL